MKESITDEPEEEPAPRDRETPVRQQSFALPRSNTGGATGFGGGASLWGPSPASATPIGAFGSFSIGASTIGEKRPVAGGSRLAHLIPKDSADTMSAKPAESPAADPNRAWRTRQRTDTDPFATDDNLAGSAILGGAQDNSPPSMASQIHRNVGFDTPVEGSAGDFGMSGLNLANHGDGNGPASPSETNPYRSPMAAERGGDDGHEHDMDRHAHTGIGPDQSSGYGTLPRSFGATAFDGSDRSQTSSVGAKGFPAVTTMTGWPASTSIATPDRERAPFNNGYGSIFSPMGGDLPTSSLGGLGGVFGAPNASSLSRGSKLESLFPPAMQAQMHRHEQEGLGDSVPDLRQVNPLGAIGRGPIGAQSRDTGSPVRHTRGAFEGLFQAPDAGRGSFSAVDQVQAGLAVNPQDPGFPVASAGLGYPNVQATGDSTATRTMVMPDRMRWIYLDPSGRMQGPFSGLEMNDWYKAQFFDPNLRVKRVEDPDFEPLGQLIRRIGNSREPFLVPQMGIAHGPPPTPGPYVMGGPAEAVPPLQNAFPSFGRTLTAAQQNDLERRKQEEQLFNARQREYQHQIFARAPIQPGHPGLHHQASAHSLQSQPSFGSMTSPIGMAQPPIGHISQTMGFFDTTPGAPQPGMGGGPDMFPSDLNIGERQLLVNLQANGGLQGNFGTQPIGAPVADISGLRSQLPSIDQLQKDPQGFDSRLKEFNDLRAQLEIEEAEEAAAKAAALAEVKENEVETNERHDATPHAEEQVTDVIEEITNLTVETTVTKKAAGAQAELSITERIKKTQADAAAAAAAAVAAATASKLAQAASSTGLPMPFPPPQQPSTPLAAPTAQRPASNLPSRYGDRSGSGTPDTASDVAISAPPPTAPWAPQPGTETQHRPSLKEIQEAEAKKAAKKEEAAAALRRAALEQEAATLRELSKAAASNSGLPPTSTWGTGSPVSVSASGSAWKQPAAVKASTPGAASGSASKKTLADIQREEEVRKQKAREAAMQASANTVTIMGKRYADLASKTSAPPGIPASGPAPVAVPMTGGGWSTVGAGGKVKIPTGPAAQTRSASASNAKTPSVVPAVQKTTSKPMVVGLKDAKSMALDEFKRWLHRELARGLVGVSDIDSFVNTLLEMPLDSTLLSDVVYQHSTTMDGRHFAEEFVRRKRLADKGIIEKEAVASTGVETKNSNGGWSEVAKKGGSGAAKEDTAIPGFRVVPAKKGKGKK